MEFPPDPLSPRPSYARIAMRRGETRRDLKTEGGEQPDRQTSDAGSEVDIRVCSPPRAGCRRFFVPPVVQLAGRTCTLTSAEATGRGKKSDPRNTRLPGHSEKDDNHLRPGDG